MPLINRSTFNPLLPFRHPFLQTVLPSAIRTISDVHYTRKRLATPDNDFIDLDWSYIGSTTVAIVMHGLEGHSMRPYMQGMVRACNRAGWDAVAVNMRGCSGEPNLLAKSYHNGSSDDLAIIIDHVAKLPYTCIKLIGFSLGGNVICKYLGEGGWTYPPSLAAAAVVSVPCHLASCAEKLARKENRFFMKRFLKLLHEKIIAKQRFFPELFSDDGYSAITTFKQFDDLYTAPLHGFANAEDYWTKAASLQFLEAITLPVLMLSAADDPFLTPSCFPYDKAANNTSLSLEITAYGGHTGFFGQSNNGEYWHERRVISFLKEYVA